MTDDSQAIKAVDVIQGILDDVLRDEVIGGDSIADVLEFVDLDVAFSPVILCPLADGFGPMHDVEVQRWADGRYVTVVTGEQADFTVIPEPALRVMRARYLLHSKLRQRRRLPWGAKEQA